MVRCLYRIKLPYVECLGKTIEGIECALGHVTGVNFHKNLPL